MSKENNKSGVSLKMNPGESRKEYLKRWQKEYRKVNRESLNAKLSMKRAENPDKHRSVQKRYRLKHKSFVYSKHREWVSKNKEKVAAYMKEYRAKNRAKISELNKKWLKENKKASRAQQRAYQNQRLANDVEYKLIHTSRRRMRESIKVKSNKKLHSTHDLLGCTPAQFKQHLESKFDANMNWSNYGDYWVVDHIKPIASFDLSKSEEQKAAFHYTNCQPMEKIANIIKSDSVEGDFRGGGQSCCKDSTQPGL